MTFPHGRGPLAITGALIAAHMLAPREAHAYLDPATGTLILQIIVASALGILVGFKRIWYGITEFFRRLFTRRTP